MITYVKTDCSSFSIRVLYGVEYQNHGKGKMIMEKIGLSRFVEAHKMSYETALAEIRRGRKESHWMWYIFPQIHGLGFSSMSEYYAIQSTDEARAFLADPYLGGNLREISSALLELQESNPAVIFGSPDNMKLKSSMTLFAAVSEDGSVFHLVLDKFFHGEMDHRTLEKIQNEINAQ